MSAGSKSHPEQSTPESGPAKTEGKPVEARKHAVSKTATGDKSGSQAGSPAFAQGAYYRQGVLVPGGPPTRTTSRGRSR
jgi:hypothetical protein